MSYRMTYLADTTTPVISPDALRIMLGHSGFPLELTQQDRDQAELSADEMRLLLTMRSGFIVEIAAELTFVDDPESERLCDFLEDMGWVRA